MAERTILLVDDNYFTLQYLERNFVQYGFVVYKATQDREAFSLAKRQLPDVIVSDVLLHVSNNHAFFKALFKDPVTNRIPVIFLSTENDTLLRLRGLCQSVNEHCTKPPNFDELLALVNKVLENQKQVLSERPKDVVLLGSLTEFSLIDVFQLLTNSSKPMEMIIDGPQGRGVLYFGNGRLVDAEYHHLRGLEAAYEVLVWSRGEFHCRISAPNRPVRIRISSEAVLLEALRRFDTALHEGKADPSLSPEAQKSASRIKIPSERQSVPSAKSLLHPHPGYKEDDFDGLDLSVLDPDNLVKDQPAKPPSAKEILAKGVPTPPPTKQERLPLSSSSDSFQLPLLADGDGSPTESDGTDSLEIMFREAIDDEDTSLGKGGKKKSG